VTSILRGIKLNRWILDPEETPWLKEGDLPSEVFKDLGTTNSCISVYEITDDISIQYTVAALAATKDFASNYDYYFIDKNILLSADLKLKPSLGETPDDTVNKRHFDIYELSAASLLQLAELLSSKGTKARVPEKMVKSYLTDGINSRRIDRSRVKDSLLQKLGIR